MTITARHALVTGGSRGIGRGIAQKLADHGVQVAINYLKDEASAKATLEQVRARGADGLIVQADVGQPQQIERMFRRVRDEFGSLDIFVANARTDVGTFYEPTLSISLEKWDTAMKLTGEGVSGRRPRSGEADARQRPHHRDHVCAGRPVRQLAVVGRDGGREVRARDSVPVFRRGARAAWHYGQRDQPRMDRRQRPQHPA